MIGDLGGIDQHRLAGLVLAVEHAQRIGVAALQALRAQLAGVRVEKLDQQLEVCRPAVGVADRVQLQLVGGDARRRAYQRVLERDHLGVDRRVLGPEHLDAELVVLAEAPALHRGVAKHGRRRTSS